tara:strand:+ start:5267 stop:6262 length:996 start_codon:yes stop_codon:yes gene_type:complete
MHLEGGSRITQEQYDAMDDIIARSSAQKRTQNHVRSEFVTHPVAGEGRIIHENAHCVVMDTNDGTWVVSCTDVSDMGKTPTILRGLGVTLEQSNNNVVYMRTLLCSMGAMGFLRQLLGALATLGITYDKMPTLCDKNMPVKVLASADPRTLVLRGGHIDKHKTSLEIPLTFDTFTPNVMCENIIRHAILVTSTVANIHASIIKHLTKWPEILPINARQLISRVCPNAKPSTIEETYKTFPKTTFEIRNELVQYVRPTRTTMIYPLPAEQPICLQKWLAMRKAGRILPEMHAPFVCMKCHNRGGNCCVSEAFAHRFVEHATQGQFRFVTCKF